MSQSNLLHLNTLPKNKLMGREKPLDIISLVTAHTLSSTRLGAGWWSACVAIWINLVSKIDKNTHPLALRIRVFYWCAQPLAWSLFLGKKLKSSGVLPNRSSGKVHKIKGKCIDKIYFRLFHLCPVASCTFLFLNLILCGFL